MVFCRPFLTIILVIGITIWLVGCGGGSGDSDSGAGSAGISYIGNTDPAVISSSNTTRLVGNIFTGQSIAEPISEPETETAFKFEGTLDTFSEKIGLTQYSSRIVRTVMQSSSYLASGLNTVLLRTDVDETTPCDNINGAIHITGSIEDDGAGILIFDFINCRAGAEITDGRVTIQVNAIDFSSRIPTDVTLTFLELTLVSPTIDLSIDGSTHSQIDLSTQTEQLTIPRLTTRNNVTDEMIMITNQVSIINYDNIFSPSSFSETITGRLYDSTHGYVDFSTLVSFHFSTITQRFPDGGQLLLTGGDDAGIRVTVISDSHVLLNLDLDGDSSFESNAALSWNELETAPDLADTDSDGIHDSWELNNGFAASDPDDANIDADMDGFSNIDEYLGGSDPNDANSTPTFADLAITKNGSPDIVVLGDNLIYTFTVTNNGPSPAYDVKITDILPVSLTLISANPSQGSCQGTLTVTCELGILDSFSTASIEIITMSTAVGSIVNSAAVMSITSDPNLNNDVATMTTNIGLSASLIQSQINAATDGVAVFISPGLYIGTINFNGKNIDLKSEQGPHVTIIDGNRTGSVVTFSSGETSDAILNGFTIQNGFSQNGGGINVESSNPIIVNNIIANNSACNGAGIRLQNASSLIDHNVIRNNVKEGCTGGNGGGGILLLGASSAEIHDNLIIDNSSSNGGGLSLFAAGIPTIEANIISGNSGGAIYMVNNSDALILQNLISHNFSSDCGGIDWLVPNGSNGPRIINNTIADNDGSQGSAICADGYDEQAVIVNNIIVAKAGQPAIYCGNFNDTNSPEIRFNNVFSPSAVAYDGFCTDQTGINGNISDDPIFVDSSNNDYRLSAGSPSIDAGDNTAPSLPFTDILKNTRTVDGDSIGSAIIDMGAYEYAPQVESEVLTFSYSDPVKDHLQLLPVRRLNPPSDAGIADLVGLVFSFNTITGGYRIILTASPENPFIGLVRLNIHFFNPNTGTTAQIPAFFSDELNDFMLSKPTTTLTLIGSNKNLLEWREGDRVAACHGDTFVELGPCLGSLGDPDGVPGFGTGSTNLSTDIPISALGKDGFRSSPPAIIKRDSQ